MIYKEGAHIHLMGICGTAMASLAGLLLEKGFRITGSDENIYPPMSELLENLGIQVMEGYKKENLDHKPDIVIVGNVISSHFEEAQALLKSDIPYTSLPKAIGELFIADRHSLVMAGTHGKTTTAAMLSWVAEVQGLQPSFFIGGIPKNFERSFRASKGDWFVIEGDEYDTAFFDKVPKFIYYRPKYVVLSSIEFDHADIYSSLDEIQSVFVELVKRVPEDGILVANADDPRVMEVVRDRGRKSRLVTYGLHSGDYRAVDREIIFGRQQFSMEYKGERVADVAIKLFGRHNILNTLSVLSLSTELDWKRSKSLQALADFEGVKRRQEVIGEIHGITIIEDFAHHPTAVNLTVESMRDRYPRQRLISIFEPRSATSRRNIFQKDYVEALKDSDVVVVPPPLGSHKIKLEERFSSVQLVNDLKELGCQATLKDSVEDIVSFLSAEARQGDVILIMSNGSFGGIYNKLLEALA